MTGIFRTSFAVAFGENTKIFGKSVPWITTEADPQSSILIVAWIVKLGSEVSTRKLDTLIWKM